MKNALRALLTAVLMVLGCVRIPGASTGPRLNAVSREAAKFVNTGWTADESILAKAVFMRAEKLERTTGFRFDRNWAPTVSLEWGLGNGWAGFDGMYKPETQTMYLPIHLIYELTARHKLAPGELSAATAAQDDELAELLDHELGHELMDQVSRRNGLGPWFTEERFNASTQQQKLGLDILSEGTARFFQRADFPRDDSRLSAATFPSSREEQRFYTYEMIAYDGGYWMVRDVLSKYGERGLVWLIRHPFVAKDDMRAAAVAYHRRALAELSSK